MAHHNLRNDQTCLNCGHTVTERFCGHCGQENIETRVSFWGLLVHFVEDLTHYEGKFWTTLKYLFTRPAYLTQTYLQGKRVSSLPPVRLYIFASFITFILPHLIPEAHVSFSKETLEQKEQVALSNHADNFAYQTDVGIVLGSRFETIEQLDSVFVSMEAVDSAMDTREYWRHKKAIQLRKYTPAQIHEMVIETINRGFPKTLFIYMPLFALVLGLFHKRKNWFYFDHAIFTLHYFSFLLLSFSAYILLSRAFEWLYYLSSMDVFVYLITLIFILMVGYFMYYFFKAHKHFYHEQAWVSSLKSLLVFSINLVLFGIVFVGLILYSLYILK